MSSLVFPLFSEKANGKMRVAAFAACKQRASDDIVKCTFGNRRIMMAKARTRIASGEKFGGSPSDLSESDLPTNADIARYFYFVCCTETDYITQLHLVQSRLLEIWEKCNPRLPLRNNKAIQLKIKGLLDSVKSYNQKRLKPQAKKYLISKKDKLFDISACSCPLPVVSCDVVHCAEDNCRLRHIVCQCPRKFKIPVEDREYMRDQREKSGTIGKYQMRGRDRKGAALEKAKQKRAEAKKGRTARLEAKKQGQYLDEVVINPVFEVGSLTFQHP